MGPWLAIFPPKRGCASLGPGHLILPLVPPVLHLAPRPEGSCSIRRWHKHVRAVLLPVTPLVMQGIRVLWVWVGKGCASHHNPQVSSKCWSPPVSPQHPGWLPCAVMLPHMESTPISSHQPRPIGLARCCSVCLGPHTWRGRPAHGELPASSHSARLRFLSPPITSPCEDTDCPQLFLAKRASCGRQSHSRGGSMGKDPHSPAHCSGRAQGHYRGAHLARSCMALGWDAGRQVCSPCGPSPGAGAGSAALAPGTQCTLHWVLHPVHPPHVPPEPLLITQMVVKPRGSLQQERGNYREPPPPDVTSLSTAMLCGDRLVRPN